MMYLVTLFSLLAVSSARDLRESLDRPMENPDLFGGDMLGIDVTDMRAIPHARSRWTGKTIPYVLDASVVPYASLIASAMDVYQKNTCIRFKKRTNEPNYIRIFQGQGCYSNVGMMGNGEQPLSLGENCMLKGLILHELGHAIGFYHEQNRADRDKYLIIYWENIKEGKDKQFVLLKESENSLINKFDYDSIMLYGHYVASKSPGELKTMDATNGQELLDPDDKEEISKSDIERVKKIYNC